MMRNGNDGPRSRVHVNEALSSPRKKELNFVKEPKKVIRRLSLRFQIVFFCCLGLLLGFFYNVCNTLLIRSQSQQNTIASNSFFGRASLQDTGSLINNKYTGGSRRYHYIDKSEFEIIPFYGDNSEAQKSVEKNDITVATYMRIVTSTTDSFQYLLDLASSWDGYISVAIYTRHTDMTLKKLSHAIKHFIKDHPNIISSKVFFHLVINKRETVSDEPDFTDFYPINFLRNLAMDNSLTDFVLNLDANFVPSLDSYHQIQSHLSQLPNNKTVMILPLFERMQNSNAQLVPASKRALFDEIEDNPYEIYPPVSNYMSYRSYGPIDYPRWYKATDPYQVGYKGDFKPYYVVQKSVGLPPFWEHFREENMISWVEEITLLGYEFYVDPDAFLVHTNPTSEINFNRKIEDEYVEFRSYLEATYGDAHWMNSKKYALKGWDRLPDEAIAAAEVLGFNRTSWNENELIPLYKEEVSNLDYKEQEAITLLGLESYFALPAPKH